MSKNFDDQTTQDELAAPAQAAPKAPAKNNGNTQKRKKLFTVLLLVVIIAATGFGFYYWLVLSREVSTDNAYVGAEIAQVTPSVGGIVKDVKVVDTQSVKQGDVLVEIDDTDAKLAFEQQKAALDQAERRVQGYFANDTGLAAQVTAREAEQQRAAAQVESATADFKRAQIDLQRRKALLKTHSVSDEEVTTAQNSFAAAEANLTNAKAAQSQADANRNAAIGSLDANKVLTSDTTVDNNPEVALARAHFDQAKVDLERTVIRAPIDGVVARRQVQLGQHVEAGTPFMTIVPVTSVHVDANFKEVQLNRVKLGQPVELESDLYGSSVKYHGKVEGLSGGTGAAFALIPAQNATGNWIKVVQRLPVRISLDPEELKQHPLQVGLSMTATIDISGN
jgi:membrane fusion protein (multidrug efflux system)